MRGEEVSVVDAWWGMTRQLHPAAGSIMEGGREAWELSASPLNRDQSGIKYIEEKRESIFVY